MKLQFLSHINMELYGSMRAFLHKLNCMTTKKRRPAESTPPPPPPPPPPTLTWLSSSFVASTEMQSQLKQVFKLIDSDGDGKISPTEFGVVLLSLGHEKSTVAKDAEGMVREADRNGDGFVDLEEFMEAVGGKREEEMEEDLAEAFLVYDTDRDGFVNAKDLQRVMAGLGIGKFSLKECKRMIGRADRNGDGRVDFEEFRSLMTSGRTSKRSSPPGV